MSFASSDAEATVEVGASLLDLEICYVRTHVGTPDHRDGHQTCYSGPPPLVRRGRPKAKLLNTLNQAVLFSPDFPKPRC